MSDVAIGQRLRASGTWAAFGRVMSGILLLVLHGVLTRSLSGLDYGRYVLIESMALMLSLVCMFGMPAVVLRTIRGKLSTCNAEGAAATIAATGWLFVATCTATAIVTVSGCYIFRFRMPDGLSWHWMPWFLVWALVAGGLRIVSEIYRAWDRYSVAYCIGGQSGGLLVNTGLVAFSLIAFLSGRMSLIAILAFQIAIQAAFLLYAVGGIRKAAIKADSRAVRTSAWLLMVAAWPLLIQQLASIGLPEAGKLLLGAYASPEATGLYNAALRLVLLAHVPLMIVNNAIQPFVTELHMNDRKTQLSNLLRGSATVAAIPAVLVFGVFLATPELVLQTVFGPEYTDAANSLRILSLGSLAWVLSGSCGLVLTMTGHERACMFSTLMPGFAYLLCCPFLIRNYGSVGAALAVSGFQLLANSICVLLVFHHLKLWTTVTTSSEAVRDFLQLMTRRNE